MQLLKTLLWIVLTVALVLFARENWNAVTINLWGGLQADVKLPILVLAAFLIGFLPLLLIHRGRMWTMKRRVEALQRQVVVSPTVAAPPSAPVSVTPEEPADMDNRPGTLS